MDRHFSTAAAEDVRVAILAVTQARKGSKAVAGDRSAGTLRLFDVRIGLPLLDSTAPAAPFSSQPIHIPSNRAIRPPQAERPRWYNRNNCPQLLIHRLTSAR